MLLAVATGLPELADELFPALAARAGPGPLTLGTAILTTETAAGAIRGTVAGVQLIRFTSWLDAHPEWREVALDGMGGWIELIMRFRFDRVPPADSG